MMFVFLYRSELPFCVPHSGPMNLRCCSFKKVGVLVACDLRAVQFGTLFRAFMFHSRSLAGFKPTEFCMFHLAPSQVV